jgi:hypothetical protein
MPPQASPVGVFNEWGKSKEVLVDDSSRCVFPRWPIGADTTGLGAHAWPMKLKDPFWQSVDHCWWLA